MKNTMGERRLPLFASFRVKNIFAMWGGGGYEQNIQYIPLGHFVSLLLKTSLQRPVLRIRIEIDQTQIRKYDPPEKPDPDTTVNKTGSGSDLPIYSVNFFYLDIKLVENVKMLMLMSTITKKKFAFSFWILLLETSSLNPLMHGLFSDPYFKVLREKVKLFVLFFRYEFPKDKGKHSRGEGGRTTTSLTHS